MWYEETNREIFANVNIYDVIHNTATQLLRVKGLLASAVPIYELDLRRQYYYELYALCI